MLIVEDHELLATALTLTLRLEGIAVESVNGPTVGDLIDAVRRSAPVLVLLDLDLGPSLGSGLDLIGPMTAAGGQVIMMTGVVERSRLGACIEAGAVGIASKAAGFGELLEAIGHAVAGEDLLSTHQRQMLLDSLQAQRQADRRLAAPFLALSPREQVVLARLVAGDSAEAIADKAYVSLATVRSQIRAILTKLGVKSQLAAVAMARQAGWPTVSTSSDRIQQS